jgi:hypothetical protein
MSVCFLSRHSRFCFRLTKKCEIDNGIVVFRLFPSVCSPTFAQKKNICKFSNATENSGTLRVR